MHASGFAAACIANMHVMLFIIHACLDCQFKYAGIYTRVRRFPELWIHHISCFLLIIFRDGPLLHAMESTRLPSSIVTLTLTLVFTYCTLQLMGHLNSANGLLKVFLAVGTVNLHIYMWSSKKIPYYYCAFPLMDVQSCSAYIADLPKSLDIVMNSLNSESNN